MSQLLRRFIYKRDCSKQSKKLLLQHSLFLFSKLTIHNNPKDISTTANIYSHVNKKMQKQATDSISKLIDG
jgi:hypothetical protein